MAITLFSEETGRYRLADGQQRSFAATDEVTDAFDELRTRTATLGKNGHAWYTTTLTITADGNFAFDFNYDELPQFEVVPSAGKWADEFRTYPRQELQARVPVQPR
nr:immunity protein YezG family protein [Myxococcus xanthus]